MSSAAAAERIVAVGDIHGAHEELLDLLRSTGLIDDAGDWSGAGTRFVQTGDYTDRGGAVRESIELLRKLERQAATGEGEVHILLGNHEVMNLIGNDRDAKVNPAIFERFVGEGSEQRHEEALGAWKKWRKARLLVQRRADPRGLVELTADLTAFLDQDEEEWLAAHPLGLSEYRAEFGTDGETGRWLRGLPVAIELDGTLFLHGGISPEVVGLSLTEINELHRRRVAEWDEQRARLEKRKLILPHFSWQEVQLALEHHLFFPQNPSYRQLAAEAWEVMNAVVADLFSATSPLWYRGYAPPPLGLADAELAPVLDASDAAYGVRRTVVGHTPQRDRRVHERLDGRLYLIDTGMLVSYYGGRPAALEIEASGVRPIYPYDEIALEAEVEIERAPRTFAGPSGEPLPIQDRAELERFLREGSPISSEPVGQGRTGALKVLLEHRGLRAHAIFHDVDVQKGSPTNPVVIGDGTRLFYFRDSYRGQVAAYELSKLLGMDNVPPVVVRELNGAVGSMALWIENGIDLFGWRERHGDDPPDPRFHRQMHDMRVFDNLIDNTDRNSQNIFWNGDFDLWLIDHTRTLSQSRKLLRPERLNRCSRELYDRLRALDEGTVSERLAPYLSRFQLRALMTRRDLVVEEIEKNIRKQGEERVLLEQSDVPKYSITVREG